MDNTITIDFDEPITVGKQDYTSITLKEPTVGQLRAAYKEKNELDMAARLVSLVSGVPIAVVDAIPQSKFKEASDFFVEIQQERGGIPDNIGDVVGEVTYFYKWGPHEAWGLTWTELEFWIEQAERISNG